MDFVLGPLLLYALFHQLVVDLSERSAAMYPCMGVVMGVC